MTSKFGFDVKFWDPAQLPILGCSLEIAFTIKEWTNLQPLAVATEVSASESNHEARFNNPTITVIENNNKIEDADAINVNVGANNNIMEDV